LCCPPTPSPGCDSFDAGPRPEVANRRRIGISAALTQQRGQRRVPAGLDGLLRHGVQLGDLLIQTHGHRDRESLIVLEIVAVGQRGHLVARSPSVEVEPRAGQPVALPRQPAGAQHLAQRWQCAGEQLRLVRAYRPDRGVQLYRFAGPLAERRT
jgi:hypothetical protein